MLRFVPAVQVTPPPKRKTHVRLSLSAVPRRARHDPAPGVKAGLCGAIIRAELVLGGTGWGSRERD